jgi:hypothetical protein
MTDVPTQPPAAGPPPSELVPEFWPPADPIEPVKGWRIYWLLAPLAAIPAVLLPRRMGPHLANSSWASAYVAHVFSGFVTVGIVFAVVTRYEGGGEPSFASVFLCNPILELRRALAGSVLFLYGMWNGWLEILEMLLAFAVIEGAIWIAALLLIPLYAAGEGARRTYFRCVKLLLWSSACQIPISWLFMHFGFWAEDCPEFPTWMLAVWATCELWWLWVLIRLGGRYAGPKEGPRWKERQPRCETCGYSLVSLARDGRCPECGVAVAESLPERRRPPAFVTARGVRGRCAGFVQTVWRSSFARRFAKNVTIWGHHRAARNYALLMCVLVGLLSAATGVAAYGVAQGGLWPTSWPAEGTPGSQRLWFFFHEFEFLAVGILCGIVGGLVVMLWMLKVGLFLSRFGFRDAADRVVILCYATTWLLVPLLLGIAGGWVAYGINETWGPFRSIRVMEDAWIEPEAAIWLACLVPAIVTLIMSFRRVDLMLRHTRFANA